MIGIIVQAILALVATLSVSVETEIMIEAPAIEAPAIEAPVSTLQPDHEANGCRIGWPCEDVDTVAVDACLDDGQETHCVWFGFLDGDGIGNSIVVDTDGFVWPIHVWEDGSYTVSIVPCGGDADCAEKNPIIANQLD